MEIGPLKSSRPTQPHARAERSTSDQPQKPAVGDRVEISDNARQKLAELADRALKGLDSNTTQSSLTESDSNGIKDGASEAQKTDSQDTARLAEIRRRIESGYYSRPDVKNKIADTLSDEFLD